MDLHDSRQQASWHAMEAGVTMPPTCTEAETARGPSGSCSIWSSVFTNSGLCGSADSASRHGVLAHAGFGVAERLLDQLQIELVEAVQSPESMQPANAFGLVQKV